MTWSIAHAVLDPEAAVPLGQTTTRRKQATAVVLRCGSCRRPIRAGDPFGTFNQHGTPKLRCAPCTLAMEHFFCPFVIEVSAPASFASWQPRLDVLPTVDAPTLDLRQVLRRLPPAPEACHV